MRRRNDPWDKPWLTIAAVVGVIAVVIIAILFFMGSGNTGPGTASPGSPTQAPSASPSQSPSASGTGIRPESIKAAPTEIVPGTGAFVKVSYIGGFAGTYGINGDTVTLRNSGERVFPLNGTTGAVSATFHKEDSSTSHEIVVEIYKDGRALKVARNSSAYGEVSVSSQV
jgi:hypothetical protein